MEKKKRVTRLDNLRSILRAYRDKAIDEQTVAAGIGAYEKAILHREYATRLIHCIEICDAETRRKNG